MAELQDDDVQALHVIEELNNSCAVPFAFKAMLKMGIPDILAAAGPDALLTAQQIVDKVVPHKSTGTADAARKLGRILRLLAHKGVFTESTTDSLTEARYGLTKASKLLVTASEYDLNPFLQLCLQPGYEEMEPLKYLPEMVKEDANAYKLAFGSDNPYLHRSKRPELLELFNSAMRSWSKLYNSNFAHHYPGFIKDDVKCLVDVGGGVGGALAVIVGVNPHIEGVNFDRPIVIATAPDIPGVKHVGGSFFESVPSGDTILLQHVLHNWGDDDCIKIIKKCHEALPHNGKLLVLENVIDPARASAEKTGAVFNSDILMMVLFNGAGGERTSGEYKRLLLASGFSHFSFLNVQGLDVIECVKT